MVLEMHGPWSSLNIPCYMYPTYNTTPTDRTWHLLWTFDLSLQHKRAAAETTQSSLQSTERLRICVPGLFIPFFIFQMDEKQERYRSLQHASVLSDDRMGRINHGMLSAVINTGRHAAHYHVCHFSSYLLLLLSCPSRHCGGGPFIFLYR